MTDTNNSQIPAHLSRFQWYAPHQAWLKSIGLKFQGDGSANPCRAVLRRAVLRRADLRDAVLRRAVLRRADLRDAVLRRAVLSGADLRDAVLRGADLSGAVLRRADLRGADLSGADLSRADLSRADLRGAEIPVIPDLDAKILAAVKADGCSLEMGSWHTCETTHCRAGWAIHLAGAAGKNLEDVVGSAAAGALIYSASRPGKRVPDFYASNSVAMADMEKCAAESAPIGQERE